MAASTAPACLQATRPNKSNTHWASSSAKHVHFVLVETVLRGINLCLVSADNTITTGQSKEGLGTHAICQGLCTISLRSSTTHNSQNLAVAPSTLTKAKADGSHDLARHHAEPVHTSHIAWPARDQNSAGRRTTPPDQRPCMAPVCEGGAYGMITLGFSLNEDATRRLSGRCGAGVDVARTPRPCFFSCRSI